MTGKLLIGVLVITIIGAAGVGIYDALTPVSIDSEAIIIPVEPAAVDTLVETAAHAKSEPVEVAILTPEVEQAAASPLDATQQPVASQSGAVDAVGSAWEGTGTITALEASGLDLTLADGSTIFLELGPAAYWQNQEALLTVGQEVQAVGFFNGEQYHAAAVTTAAGQQIELRSETGQPLWSGGANNDGSSEQAATQGEVQVAAEDWLTINGVVTSVSNNLVTFQPADGTAVQDVQLGRPDFWQTQGVTLAVGDDINVLGFWQGEQFQVGEIANTLTGDRIMLRDPNGRPLWGGPGRNGNGGQESQGQGSQGQGSQGQGSQGHGGQGQGSQGQGGQGQNQAANLIPVEQWITIDGNIVSVEPLRLMVQTAAGETALVNLGQEDFWTAEGYSFTIPETVTVDGYWLNGQFEAGRLTTSGDMATTLVIRDDSGQLVYGSSTGQGNGGQGQQGGQGGKQYRGGRS